MAAIITMEQVTMIDIHCHLLFNIDDGSRSIEESISILKSLKEIGYSDIIITPHYIKDSKYNSNKKNNFKLLNKLEKELDKEMVKINLYLGNEIYIDDDIIGLLKNNEISSLNGSNYLLIELPMSGEYDNYIEIFKDLINNNYRVILAHPERYYSFQKDFNKIIELESIGVLYQSNIESIIGKYGKGAKKLIKKLLKLKIISFLATDIHHIKHNYSDYNKAYKKILKYISEDELNVLINKNPKKVIDNKKITKLVY